MRLGRIEQCSVGTEKQGPPGVTLSALILQFFFPDLLNWDCNVRFWAIRRTTNPLDFFRIVKPTCSTDEAVAHKVKLA
jgi:hypothetical protein